MHLLQTLLVLILVAVSLFQIVRKKVSRSKFLFDVHKQSFTDVGYLCTSFIQEAQKKNCKCTYLFMVADKSGIHRAVVCKPIK